jgi:hypothetical protein
MILLDLKFSKFDVIWTHFPQPFFVDPFVVWD